MNINRTELIEAIEAKYNSSEYVNMMDVSTIARMIIKDIKDFPTTEPTRKFKSIDEPKQNEQASDISELNAIRDEFQEDTDTKWWTNPVCHGEVAYASWGYQLWLERELIKARSFPTTEPKLPTVDEIVNVLYDSVKHLPIPSRSGEIYKTQAKAVLTLLESLTKQPE